ncbi:MAG: RAMP superfamily CRISPR-associated protein [candidate division WOR-3 bacterium]
MKENKICKIYYIKGILEAISPILIGNGEDELTDIDFVRDGEGKIFVPATTIAGKIRSFLKNCIKDDLIDYCFGNLIDENGDVGNQSIFKFYDGNVCEKEKNKVREGVSIDYETKTSIDKSKFDYEIVDVSNKFLLRLEVVLRENILYKEKEIEEIIYIIISSLKNGEISFGAKTNRGLGKVILQDEKIQKVDVSKNIKEWINFQWDSIKENIRYEDLNHKIFNLDKSDICKIEVFFDIPYSILIREYKIEEDVDATQIQSNGRPIIPGTSWAGFFRSSCYQVLKELNKDAEKVINDLFGYVKESDKTSKPSKIVFEESVIENGKLIPNTRIRIDRFTGGNIESALFCNEPCFNGKTKLKIFLKEKDESLMNSYIELLMLVLREIDNGIYAIGGETNVGRGLLKISKVLVNDKEKYIKDFEKNGYENLMKIR